MDSIQLSGIDDLKRALAELKIDLHKRVVRAALRDAAAPIVQAARSLAPTLRQPHKGRTIGLLRRSIVVRSIPQRSLAPGDVGVYVKPIRKKGAHAGESPDDPFYWWWLEFGTKHIARGKFSFLLVSGASQFRQSTDIFMRRVIARIDKANARTGK